MSKKLIILLIAFFTFLSALILVKFYLPKEPAFISRQAKQMTPTKILSTSLSLLPDHIVTTTDKNSTVSISISPVIHQGGMLIAQFELAYDPNSIFVTGVTPGTYLANPEVILNNINYRTGRISYALKGSISPSAQSSTLAQIKFNSTNYNFLKESKISFLPKTLIRSNEENVNINSMNDTKIVFQQAYFVKPASPSAIQK